MVRFWRDLDLWNIRMRVASYVQKRYSQTLYDVVGQIKKACKVTDQRDAKLKCMDTEQ